MTVAGFGFTTTTTLAALREALTLASGPQALTALTALATPQAKAGTAALRALAGEMNLPLIGITPADLQAQTTVTRSARALALYGTGSVAEAAALAGAGPGARLLATRAISTDGTATAAIAAPASARDASITTPERLQP